MAVPYKLPRGTRAALDALAGASGLIPYQAYWITDENRIAVAVTNVGYVDMEKRIHIGTSAPSDTSRIWIDTN